MSSIFHYKHYEIALFPYSSSLNLRVLDTKHARCFEAEFSDNLAKTISKSLCLDSKDLFSLIQRAITSSNEFLSLEILPIGSLMIRCILQFPIEKLLEFTIPLQELELNEYRQGLYRLQDLEARMEKIEGIFKKEQLKIRRNTHFPSFEGVSETRLTGLFSFMNKRKSAIRAKQPISIENELLEGTRLDFIGGGLGLIKFSVLFKGRNPMIDGYIGVCFDKELGFNKKGNFILGHGVVHWDGTFFNSTAFIRNSEVMSVLISREKELIRWEDQQGEKIFEGRLPNEICNKTDWADLRPIAGIINESDSINFV